VMKRSVLLLLLLVVTPILAADREALKRDLVAHPSNAANHLALAKAFEAESFRVPAIFEYLRFLALESETPRSVEAAKRLDGMLSVGVQQTDKGMSLTIDPSSRKEEGDYQSAELMIALAAAAASGSEKGTPGEFGKVFDQLTSALAMIGEGEWGTDYTAVNNIKWLRDLQKKELVNVLVGSALLPLQLDGSKAWEERNRVSISRLRAEVKPE